MLHDKLCAKKEHNSKGLFALDFFNEFTIISSSMTNRFDNFTLTLPLQAYKTALQPHVVH